MPVFSGGERLFRLDDMLFFPYFVLSCCTWSGTGLLIQVADEGELRSCGTSSVRRVHGLGCSTNYVCKG